MTKYLPRSIWTPGLLSTMVYGRLEELDQPLGNKVSSQELSASGTASPIQSNILFEQFTLCPLTSNICTVFLVLQVFLIKNSFLISSLRFFLLNLVSLFLCLSVYLFLCISNHHHCPSSSTQTLSEWFSVEECEQWSGGEWILERRRVNSGAEESEQLHPALVLIGQQDRTGSTGWKEEACTGHTWSVGSPLLGGGERIA